MIISAVNAMTMTPACAVVIFKGRSSMRMDMPGARGVAVVVLRPDRRLVVVAVALASVAGAIRPPRRRNTAGEPSSLKMLARTYAMQACFVRARPVVGGLAGR